MCLPDTNHMFVMRKLYFYIVRYFGEMLKWQLYVWFISSALIPCEMQSELVPLVDPAGAGPYSGSSHRWSP